MNGRLSFTAHFVNGRTRICDTFFSPPFNLANITAQDSEELQLMLRSTSPGILDGDAHALDIKLGPRARVVLTTQSFQRLFDMKKGASQLTSIEIAAGASLEFISQPSVPHANSIFRADTRINLQASAKLFYGEVLTCGRALNGEHFQFTSYQNRTVILIDNKPVVRENLCILPGAMDIMQMGFLEGHTHQASLTCVNDEGELDRMTEMISLSFQPEHELTWGISRPAKNVLVLRLLGYSAYKLYDMLQDICAAFKTTSTVR